MLMINDNFWQNLTLDALINIVLTKKNMQQFTYVGELIIQNDSSHHIIEN